MRNSSNRLNSSSVSSFFQYSIGDASSSTGCAKELPTTSDFQYSIGDAIRYAVDAVERYAARYFQYSIGDAVKAEFAASEFRNIAFQYSIGDAEGYDD